MTTRAMTYSELGAALGITAASAKRLAVRNRWEKSVGNDGRSRVNVPVERLEAARDIPNDSPGDDTSASTGDITGAVTSDARALIAHLETTAADLRARLARAEDELATLRPLAAELAQAKAQVAAEARRAEDVAIHAAALVQAADRHADDLRAALERTQAARGWFARWRRSA